MIKISSKIFLGVIIALALSSCKGGGGDDAGSGAYSAIVSVGSMGSLELEWDEVPIGHGMRMLSGYAGLVGGSETLAVNGSVTPSEGVGPVAPTADCTHIDSFLVGANAPSKVRLISTGFTAGHGLTAVVIVLGAGKGNVNGAICAVSADTLDHHSAYLTVNVKKH